MRSHDRAQHLARTHVRRLSANPVSLLGRKQPGSSRYLDARAGLRDAGYRLLALPSTSAFSARSTRAFLSALSSRFSFNVFDAGVLLLLLRADLSPIGLASIESHDDPVLRAYARTTEALRVLRTRNARPGTRKLSKLAPTIRESHRPVAPDDFDFTNQSGEGEKRACRKQLDQESRIERLQADSMDEAQSPQHPSHRSTAQSRHRHPRQSRTRPNSMDRAADPQTTKPLDHRRQPRRRTSFLRAHGITNLLDARPPDDAGRLLPPSRAPLPARTGPHIHCPWLSRRPQAASASHTGASTGSRHHHRQYRQGN